MCLQMTLFHPFLLIVQTRKCTYTVKQYRQKETRELIYAPLCTQRERIMSTLCTSLMCYVYIFHINMILWIWQKIPSFFHFRIIFAGFIPTLY